MSMLVRMEDWNQVRDQFTDLEKKLLNEAITGQTICPRGVIIDEDHAVSLAVKLKNLIREIRKT